MTVFCSTGTAAWPRRTACSTSRPLMSGMRASRITRSHGPCARAASAALPSRAMCTHAPSARSICSIMYLLASLSSATRMRRPTKQPFSEPGSAPPLASAPRSAKASAPPPAPRSAKASAPPPAPVAASASAHSASQDRSGDKAGGDAANRADPADASGPVESTVPEHGTALADDSYITSAVDGGTAAPATPTTVPGAASGAAQAPCADAAAA